MKRRRIKSFRRYQPKKRLKVPGKFIGIGIIIILAIAIILLFIWKALITSDYFVIRDVVVREPNVADFSYLKGKNIFNISLDGEIKGILENYPNYSQIKLIRVLPNRIFVDFVRRKPVAFVKLSSRIFAVDNNGILFYISEKPGDFGLPLISGLDNKITGPRPGRRNNLKELVLALSIISEAKANKILRYFKISKIDVANIEGASFFLTFPPGFLKSKIQDPVVPEDLEVKIGEGDIKDKLSVLGGLVIQGRTDLGNVKYVDLRFKEAVIKLKDKDKNVK